MNVTTKTVAEDDRYHVSLRRDSRIIRFYLWLYEARPNRINTCKLFWAYILAPFALIFRGIFAILAPVFAAIERHRDRHRPTFEQRQEWRQAAKRKANAKAARGPGRMERWLEAFTGFAGMVWFRLQKPITYLAFTIGVLCAVAIVGFLIYECITKPIEVLIFLGFVVGIVLLGLLLIVVFAWLDQSGKGKAGMNRFGNTMKTCYRAVHDHTCAIVDVQEKA